MEGQLERKSLNVVRVEIEGGQQRGRLILSDGSELGGVISLDLEEEVTAAALPKLVLRLQMRGPEPGASGGPIT